MNNFESESKALKSLLNSSRRSETLEKVVSTRDWDEVCSWQKVIPMCHYVQKSHLKGKKKKAVKKFKSSSSSTIINSNNNDNKLFNQHRINLQSSSLQTETSKDALTSQDRCLKSTNVLSYDVPSWRFLVDAKKFNYIERIPPKDKVYNLLSQCMSSPQYKTAVNVLDPASVLDEGILQAYKVYQDFQPNKDVMELFSKFNSIPISSNVHEIHNHLYTRTANYPKNIIIDEGESDDNKIFNTYKAKNTSKKKKAKHNHSIPKRTKFSRFLPVNNKLLSKDNHQKPIKAIDTSNSKRNSLFDPTIRNTTSEELYLPLLNHSNYTSKAQYIKRADIKLPPVAGIKMFPVSGASLVL